MFWCPEAFLLRLFYRDASLGEFFDHEVEVGFDVDGLAGVTGTAAVKKACELGLIEKGATVVSVVTGNGLKDVANAIKSAGEPINIKPDLDLMVEEFAKRGVTVE